MYPVRELSLAILFALGTIGLGAGLALAVQPAVVTSLIRM